MPDQRIDDLANDLVLYSEYVVQAAVEALGPQMSTADGVDQLRIDAHPSGGAAGAAFQQIAHAEIAGDGAGIDRLALVGEGRVARDDEQTRRARQVGDQILGQAVDEDLLLRVAV